VSAAGHRRPYRAQARFEYTVIGTGQRAARLTELAKLESGHVLASAIAVSDALDAEALRWDVARSSTCAGAPHPLNLLAR